MGGLFLEWFFVLAPRYYTRSLGQVIDALASYFSLSLHAKTLVAPWRRDAVSLDRLPIQLWFQAIIQNVISRGIGFMLRVGVLLIGSVMIFVFCLGSAIFFVAWYVLPLLLAGSILYGFMLIMRAFYG